MTDTDLPSEQTAPRPQPRVAANPIPYWACDGQVDEPSTNPRYDSHAVSYRWAREALGHAHL